MCSRFGYIVLSLITRGSCLACFEWTIVPCADRTKNPNQLTSNISSLRPLSKQPRNSSASSCLPSTRKLSPPCCTSLRARNTGAGSSGGPAPCSTPPSGGWFSGRLQRSARVVRTPGARGVNSLISSTLEDYIFYRTGINSEANQFYFQSQ